MTVKQKLLLLGAVGLVAVTGWRFEVWNYASADITNQSALKIADTREALVSTEFIRESVDNSAGGRQPEAGKESGGRNSAGQEDEGKQNAGYCLKITNNTNNNVEVLVSYEAVEPGTGNPVDGVMLEAVTGTVVRGGSIELPIILTVPKGLKSDGFDIKATVISTWDGGNATITDYLKGYRYKEE